MVITTLGITIAGTDITRTIIRIMDIITDMAIILTMVIVIITDTIIITMVIIQDHVVKDMQLQAHWVETETIINHIIEHMVMVMCQQHQQRLRKMWLQQERRLRDRHIVRVTEPIPLHIKVRECLHVLHITPALPEAGQPVLPDLRIEAYSRTVKQEVLIPDLLQVQLHVDPQVLNHVLILHLKEAKAIVDPQLSQVEVTARLQEVVHRVIADLQGQVVQVEVIRVEVPAGVPVGVVAGVPVERGNY